jgi:protein-tyrosine phosphatase
MFQIFKSIYTKPLFHGLCDIHNHLLPGIDDGSKNLSMTQEMLEGLGQLGFHSLWFTPHIFEELYPNTPHTIQKSYDLVFKELKCAPSIEIKGHAAEYMVDESFYESIAKKRPSQLIKNQYLLIEMNLFGNSQILEEVGFQINQMNLYPILAHPERYLSIKTMEKFKELKDKGFYFQLNALSLMGFYGKFVKKKAHEMLAMGLFDFVGTDAHHPRQIKMLSELRLTKKQGIHWEAIRSSQLDTF